MEEQYSSPIPEQYPASSRLDIDLEQMEALADPTLSPEVRERNTPRDIDTNIQKEVMLQQEYARVIALYLRLEEAIESGSMPDFRRVSTSMPPAINTLIDEGATELMKLSLYASTTIVLVKKELETMIRRHAFEERIAGVRTQMEISKKRLERLTAPTPDPDSENKRKAEEILATMKEKGEVPMIPMPVPEKKPQAKGASFWGDLRKRLLQ